MTAIIKSNNRSIRFLKKYFEEKNDSPDLIYLDSHYVWDKTYFDKKCIIKNLFNEKKRVITRKDNLHKLNLKWFVPYVKSKKDLQPDKLYISKPVKGFKGSGIKIDYGRNIKFNKDCLISEYVKTKLIDKKKFHCRYYIIPYLKDDLRLFLFPEPIIVTAKDNYKHKDFHNNDIHDSHRKPSDKVDYKMPFDILDDVKQCFKDVFKDIKLESYNESKYAFEIFGADIIITEDNEVKLLEINEKISTNTIIHKRNSDIFFKKLFDSIVKDIISDALDKDFKIKSSHLIEIHK